LPEGLRAAATRLGIPPPRPSPPQILHQCPMLSNSRTGVHPLIRESYYDDPCVFFARALLPWWPTYLWSFHHLSISAICVIVRWRRAGKWLPYIIVHSGCA
jgi:hypothetical protein